MDFPKWIHNYIETSDLEKIEKAVELAETKTSGELVPVVVKSSSTTGHVPFVVMMLFVTLFLIFDLDHQQMEWFDAPEWVFYGFDLFLLFVLTRLVSPIPWVQRRLIPKADRAFQVEQRALVEFYDHKIHQTRESTGILLFISLMEHQAVVLGDESIAKKLQPEVWQGVIGRFVKGVKSKNLASGLIAGIEASGELLESHFPIRSDDTNELKNHLIIKE